MYWKKFQEHILKGVKLNKKKLIKITFVIRFEAMSKRKEVISLEESIQDIVQLFSRDARDNSGGEPLFAK